MTNRTWLERAVFTAAAGSALLCAYACRPDEEATKKAAIEQPVPESANGDEATRDGEEATSDGDEATSDGGQDEEPDAAVDAGDRPVEPELEELRRIRADKVDVLLVIDNSSSMAQEQMKLSAALPNFVRALATGNRDGKKRAAGVACDFTPVQSLHIGIVTSDMGVNGAPPSSSCGALSFELAERDPRHATRRVNKPVGDDGVLQIDTDVALAGIFIPSETGGSVVEAVPGDPSCAGITFPTDARFVDYSAGADAEDAAHRFSCIVKRGRNGCGLEQQLEAALKALTPADSGLGFTAASPRGHGGSRSAGVPAGLNQNFLRDDAVLVIVDVSDEEDCSAPDESRAIFDPASGVPGGINVRCGLSENQGLLHDVSRYVAGFAALKPAAYRDRVIFAAVAGMPVASDTGAATHSGAQLDALLGRPDMQFKTRRNVANTDDEPVPTCISARGDGSAAPGRRHIEVAKSFGDSGVVTSICEDQYQALAAVLVDKIAVKLTAPAP